MNINRILHRRDNRRPPVCIPAVLAGIVVLLATAPAWAGLPVQPDPAVEAKVDSLVRAAVDQAFAGRLDLGLRTVDRAEEIAPRDPRIGLTRFRLLRENYPVGVYQKSLARQQEPALLAELEHTIAICDSMLAIDDRNAAAYLYRGWAYINQAQTYLIAKHLRATAGASRRGKSDFDKFYEIHPQGDPDAATVWGSYLFFADTLPGFFKFLRWVVRVPGGDRERGLELIREGAAGRGYTYPDAELVLAVTYYLFDGNLEESAGMLEKAVARFPHHPWVVEYSSSLSFLYPHKTDWTIRSLSTVLDGWGNTTRGWDDSVRYRLWWSRAQMYNQKGLYEDALRDMERLIEASPAQPFWVAPHAHVAAIELAGNLGRSGEVARLCAMVPDDDRYRRVAELTQAACNGRAGEYDDAGFARLGAVCDALYSGRVEEAQTRLQETTADHGEGVRSVFLHAEIARYGGRSTEAFELYTEANESIKRVTEPKVRKRQTRRSSGSDEDDEDESDEIATGDVGLRVLRVKALLQMGELCIERRDYDGAKRYYEEAEEVEPRETMFANMIRGRIRFIERQQN